MSVYPETLTAWLKPTLLSAFFMASLGSYTFADELSDVRALKGAWQGRTSLYEALFRDRKEDVRRLLEAGADVEMVCISKRGRQTALMHACSAEMARILVEAGADVNAVGAEGMTPLMGDLLNCPEAVKYLLEQGANPRARDDKGNTPLHHCKYSAESARLLIEAGADVNARNAVGNTPLMEQYGVRLAGDSIGYGESLVRLLLQLGANPEARNNAGMTALDLAMTRAASWYGENPVLFLLQRDGRSASLHAQLVGSVAAGRVELCKSLLRQGADPNAFGRNAPNALAAALGHVIEPGEHALELTELLLAAGANPNLAASDIMSRCRFPANREKILELLFQHGYDLSQVDPFVLRNTLLQEQDSNGNSAFMAMLLKNGADRMDETALAQDLRKAVESGDSPAIYRVHNVFFDINTRLPGEIPTPFADGKNHGGHALLLAAAWGRTEAVRVLLAMESDVNLPDAAGRTALEYAAAAGHAEIVSALLRAGASHVAEAEQYARQYGHAEIADLIRKFGSQ